MAKTIMVVDDQDDTLTLVKAVLEFNKFKVVVFNDPRRALIELNKGKLPGLLIVDMKMPNMTGTQFCRALKKEKKFAKLKIAIFSASIELKDSILKECNAVGFIFKPFDNNELIGQVKKYLK